MKKIALTSLLAVFAAAGANAANVIDGNPLYMPAQGRFVSETSLGSHSENDQDWKLTEHFGWGITDRIMVGLKTSVMEHAFFENFAWNEVAVDGTYRLIGDGAWKLDLTAGFEVDPMRAYHNSMWEKDMTKYSWIAGVRGGYMTEDWTLSAHANFIYTNSAMFNWAYDDEYTTNHNLNLGVAGHWTFSDRWSAIASADYEKVLDSYFDANNHGKWKLAAGLNFNFDETKYLGVYITKDIVHNNGDWESEDGIGFGVKFGIDF